MDDMQRRRQAMHERLEHLRALRDEIRLEVHLGGMELRERWRELEPTMRDAERLAGEVSDVARDALDETVARFRAFRDAVRERRDAERHAPS